MLVRSVLSPPGRFVAKLLSASSPVLIPLVSLPWVGPGCWATVVVLVCAAAVHSSLAIAGYLEK